METNRPRLTTLEDSSALPYVVISQGFKEARKSVPVAGGEGRAETFLELAERPNGTSHVAVKTESKPSLNRDEPDEPILAGRQFERKDW